MRRIINYYTILLSKCHGNSKMQFAMSSTVHADLLWWQVHLLKFNGTRSITPTVFITHKEGDNMYIATDACTTGYGAIFGKYWLHGTWTDEQDKQSRSNDTSSTTTILKRDSMPYKELLSIVIATATWGHLFTGHNMTFNVDCQPIVYALNKGDSRRANIMHLIRIFTSLAIKYNFNYRIIHIAGVLNIYADSLSRSQITTFHTQSQQHQSHPLSFHLLPTIPIIPHCSL